MLNTVKLVLSVAIIAFTAASASAATKHPSRPDAATTMYQSPMAMAFALSSGGKSQRIRETGAELYQDRGNAEADGLPFSRY